MWYWGYLSSFLLAAILRYHVCIVQRCAQLRNHTADNLILDINSWLNAAHQHLHILRCCGLIAAKLGLHSWHCCG